MNKLAETTAIIRNGYRIAAPFRSARHTPPASRDVLTRSRIALPRAGRSWPPVDRLAVVWHDAHDAHIPGRSLCLPHRFDRRIRELNDCPIHRSLLRLGMGKIFTFVDWFDFGD